MSAAPAGPLPPLVSVTLAGRTVRLEPLSANHVAALARVGLDPEIWRWMPAPVADEAGLEAWVREALESRAAGTALPFVILSTADGAPIGSTRFLAIDRANRRVEIGATWLAKAWQRTAANTEAKLLLMTHAFETLGVNRVEFKTDALNERSRAALLRLGAKEEGTLRAHMVTASGRIRDSVYFSVTAPEWPTVKAGLAAKLR